MDFEILLSILFIQNFRLRLRQNCLSIFSFRKSMHSLDIGVLSYENIRSLLH